MYIPLASGGDFAPGSGEIREENDMGKSRKPRRKGKTKEQRAAEAACHAEIGESIKRNLSTAELNELVASIVRMENKAKRAGQAEGVRFAFTICMLALCDKFGFGKVRLDRLWSCCKGYVDDIGAGRMDFEAVAAALEEDYGIKVQV